MGSTAGGLTIPRIPRRTRGEHRQTRGFWQSPSGLVSGRRLGIRSNRPISPLLMVYSARTIGEKLSVLSERARKFRNLGIQCRLSVDVPTPATWQPARLPGGALHAEPGALHGTVRPRARVHFKQGAPCHRYPHDFCRDYPCAFPEVGLGRGIVSRRVGAFVSRTPDGRKSSGLFSGTDLFARWANLGRSRSLDVSLASKPQADLRRYPAKLRLELRRRAAATRVKNTEVRRRFV